MTPARTILLILAASLVVGAAAAQTEADVTNAATNHSYSNVVVQNAVGLNPPPMMATQVQSGLPVPRFFLEGIVTISGKKALLKAVLQPRRDEPAKEEYFMLAEGERKGDLRIVAIDEKAGTVKVTWAGTLASLNFSDNAVKAASATAPGPATLPPPEATPNLSGSNPPPKRPAYPPVRPIRSFSMERDRDGDGQEYPTQVWADSQRMGTFFPRQIPMRIWPGPLFLPVYSWAFGSP